jgi:hypothetical protein
MSRTPHPRRRQHALVWDEPDGGRMPGAVAPWLTRAVAAHVGQADDDLARLLGVQQTTIKAARAALREDHP